MDSINHHQKTGARCCVAALMAVAVVFGGCGSHEEHVPGTLIAGTSLMADIITDLTGDAVVPFTLLPSSSCPSQFDMKAGDIGRLQQATAMFLHPWQLQLANIKRVIDAAKLQEGRLHLVEVNGNWMLPDMQRAAAAAMAVLLGDMYPEQRDAIRERAEARRRNISDIETRAHEALADETLSGITVVCNEMQAPFVRWAGFDVADTYARPEDWSVAETERLVALGRARRVALVIDNLQSGGMRMSETLARDIGAVNVVLSNFPNGFPDTTTWEAAFMDNINRLEGALARIPRP